MPRIVKYFVGLFTLLLVFTLPTIVVSCDTQPVNDNYDVSEESSVAEQVHEIICPTFTNVQQVLDFRSRCKKEAFYDSVFIAMPEQALNDVANVLITRQDNVCSYTIVKEYLNHRDIYDNLQPSEQSLQNSNDIKSSGVEHKDNSAMEGQRATASGVISRSYQYRTDTVDGKPVKILIKTEESYDE